MALSNKTVLVTGAAGFIGLNVVKAYAAHGWCVYALVHKNVPEELLAIENVRIIKGDITRESCFRGLDVDVVAHVAGIASDIGADKDFRRINFEPVKHLSKLAKTKFVYVSSSDVYGIKDFENADETSPLLEFPKNPYPKYKIMAEKWIIENCARYVIVRPAAVYGEGDKTLEKRVVDFLRVSPFIVHFGKWKGKNRWPVANVKNVAETIVSVSVFDDFDNQAITIVDAERMTIDDYYRNIAKRYYPEKKYKNLYLPLWLGKLIGLISTVLSNALKLKHPLFDPTYYAVHHVSSNLDFSSDKMLKAINRLSYL